MGDGPQAQHITVLYMYLSIALMHLSALIICIHKRLCRHGHVMHMLCTLIFQDTVVPFKCASTHHVPKLSYILSASTSDLVVYRQFPVSPGELQGAFREGSNFLCISL